MTAVARRCDAIHNGSLQRGLLLAILVMLGVGATAFLRRPQRRRGPPLPVNLPAMALWLLVVAAGAAVVRWHGHRLLALILTSVVGLVVSLTFVYLSAPDLGLTQLSVEVVTTVLMLLALELPAAEARRREPSAPAALARRRDRRRRRARPSAPRSMPC